MSGSTVFAIDQHHSWRGTKTSPPLGLFRRFANVASNCRLVLKYLLAGGSLTLELQKDCVLISRKASSVLHPLESENHYRPLFFSVRPPA